MTTHICAPDVRANTRRNAARSYANTGQDRTTQDNTGTDLGGVVMCVRFAR